MARGIVIGDQTVPGAVGQTNPLPIRIKDGTTGNDIAPATTLNEYNITMTNADTEYSQALPANTRAFEFQCRGDYDIRFAFTIGKVATPTAPYQTLKSGMQYYKEDVNLIDKTLYVACGTAAQIVGLICYT